MVYSPKPSGLCSVHQDPSWPRDARCATCYPVARVVGYSGIDHGNIGVFRPIYRDGDYISFSRYGDPLRRAYGGHFLKEDLLLPATVEDPKVLVIYGSFLERMQKARPFEFPTFLEYQSDHMFAGVASRTDIQAFLRPFVGYLGKEDRARLLHVLRLAKPAVRSDAPRDLPSPRGQPEITPVSPSMTKYRDLEERLRGIRSSELHNSAAEDEVLEQMSDLWWNLSDEERETLDREGPTCGPPGVSSRLSLAPYYSNEQQRMLRVGKDCNVVLSVPALFAFETPEARTYRFQSQADLVSTLTRLILKKELSSGFDEQARALLSSLGYPVAPFPDSRNHSEILRLGGAEEPVEDRVLIVGKKFGPLEPPACSVFEDEGTRVYVFQTTHALRKALTEIWITDDGLFASQAWGILHDLEAAPPARERHVLCQAGITNSWVQVGKDCPQPPTFFDTRVVEETHSWVFQFSDKDKLRRALNSWIRDKNLPVPFENQARTLLARLQKADRILRPNWTTPVDPEAHSRVLDEFRRPGGEGQKMADATAKELQEDWDSRIIEGRKQSLRRGIEAWFRQHPHVPVFGTTPGQLAALHDFLGSYFATAEVDQAVEAYRSSVTPTRSEEAGSLPSEPARSSPLLVDIPISLQFRVESSERDGSWVGHCDVLDLSSPGHASSASALTAIQDMVQKHLARRRCPLFYHQEGLTITTEEKDGPLKLEVTDRIADLTRDLTPGIYWWKEDDATRHTYGTRMQIYTILCTWKTLLPAYRQASLVSALSKAADAVLTLSGKMEVVDPGPDEGSSKKSKLNVVAVPTEKDGDSRRIVADRPILQYENETNLFYYKDGVGKIFYDPATFQKRVEDETYDLLPSPATVKNEASVLIRMGAKFMYAFGEVFGGTKPVAVGRYTSTFFFRDPTEARAALENIPGLAVHYDEQEEICRALRTLKRMIRCAHPPTNDVEERT